MNHSKNLYIGREFLRQVNPDVARVYFEGEMEERPNEVAPVAGMVSSLLLSGRFAQAVRLAEEFANKRSSYVDAQVLAGDTNRWAGNGVAATTFYHRALSLSETAYGAKVGQALMLLDRRGNRNEIRALVKDVPLALLSEGEASRLLFNLRCWDEGINAIQPQLDLLEKELGEDREDRWFIALLCHDVGLHARGLAVLEQQDVLTPIDQEIKVILLLALKQWGAVLSELDGIFRVDHWRHWALASWAHYALENYRDALHASDRAIELQSESHSPWMVKAGALVKLGMPRDASLAAEEGFRRFPENNRVYGLAVGMALKAWRWGAAFNLVRLKAKHLKSTGSAEIPP